MTLRWTVPTRTTDGLDIAFPMTSEICRDKASPNSETKRGGRKTTVPQTSVLRHEDPCTPLLRVPGDAGEATDRLADRPPAPDDHVLAYRVRILNQHGRFASPASVAYVPGSAGAGPVSGFRAVQEANGVVLEWADGAGCPAGGTQEAVEVLRRETAASQDGSGSAAKAPAGKPAAAEKQPRGMLPGPKRAASGEVRLRAGQGTNGGSESRGMVDREALEDHVYTYSAHRVCRMTRDGRSLESQGEATAPVTVALRDTFAPAPPQGLFSVPGEAGPGGSRKMTIDLSWQPNTEADLAGYRVYRTDADAGASKPVLLTPALLPGPSFRDTTVTPGRRYRYVVTAVDRTGNESGPGSPVDDTAATP